MLIIMYYVACQRIFSFTYLEFVPVTFRMANLKVVEMQVLRSHHRPTELWRCDPIASFPGVSDAQENLRTTALNRKVKLNSFILFNIRKRWSFSSGHFSNLLPVIRSDTLFQECQIW